jgi:hypothetical protein
MPVGALCQLRLLLSNFKNDEVLWHQNLLQRLNRLLEYFAPVGLFVYLARLHKGALVWWDCIVRKRFKTFRPVSPDCLAASLSPEGGWRNGPILFAENLVGVLDNSFFHLVFCRFDCICSPLALDEVANDGLYPCEVVSSDLVDDLIPFLLPDLRQATDILRCVDLATTFDYLGKRPIVASF